LVKKFAILNNTKKRDISNFIIFKIKNFDNIIIKIIINKKLNIRLKLI